MSFPPMAGMDGGACAAGTPMADPNNIVVGMKECVTLVDSPRMDAIMRLPLPGIVIFVHGVNSDGEWYAPSQEGLCAGLNERLKRCEGQLAHPTVEGGQLAPVGYLDELTQDGYINPKRKADTFIKDEQHFSPVINFRWGYKADSKALQEYGGSVYLNEHGYWGGGPFANGCTALADLWNEGLSERLFLWLQVQHFNPTPDRKVFSCPPRAYYVLAALRLARLIESIRKKQADVPITVVCHSQGNMVGIAAAFLGDQLDERMGGPVSDAAGISGRRVADSYVLTNPPYSLVKSNFAENFTQSNLKDPHGGTGRQTSGARTQTLREFFNLIRTPGTADQSADRIDKVMANKVHGFDADTDRKNHGYGIPSRTCCRVTLYCNPHDQVISAATVQGIGWRGMDQQEIDATGGEGVFTQRVFANYFEVGAEGKREYHYWKNHYRQPTVGSQDYWFPESQIARYSAWKGVAASDNFVYKILTLLGTPLFFFATEIARTRVNALPPKNWVIPLKAPRLPKPFLPQSMRFGQSSADFDEGYSAPGQERDAQGVREAGDPYHGDRAIPDGPNGSTDAAKGDVQSEAALRYDDHARLRMEAKREGISSKASAKTQEDSLDNAGADYIAWRDKKIRQNLEDCIKAHATDHSTIMTNGMHARQALAYDVAIGVCDISDDELRKIRIAADWRLLKSLDDSDLNQAFDEYFETGLYKKKIIVEWTREKEGEANMPIKIFDKREDF